MTKEQLKQWLTQRIIELQRERGHVRNKFIETDDDQHLDKLIGTGAQITAYNQVLEYVRQHWRR